MSALIAVPNVSEGRDKKAISRYSQTISRVGARVLDIHSDAAHNRSVFTVAGEAGTLVEAMTALAVACGDIDLSIHEGAHPRLGGLDVCPFVPLHGSMAEAIAIARTAGRSVHERTGIPVYFYGEAATRSENRDLPALRKGGLATLIERARAGWEPDHGLASEIDEKRGVICVGARGVLIAFNVWLRCTGGDASELAAAIRQARARGGSGLEGVRALGLEIDAGTAQVSTSITDPDVTSIDETFAAIALRAELRGIEVLRTELVGLVPQRYLPDPNAAAAQLLSEPGRSLEAALVDN
jgi:glutamate formiminotransferase